MKTLTLSLKRKWFEMIRDGVKLEEYREMKFYYWQRFVNKKEILEAYHDAGYKGRFIDAIVRTRKDNDEKLLLRDYKKNFDKLVFTLGYPKAGDSSMRLEFKNPKIRIVEGKPEWGAEPGKNYFVISWDKP